jgi:putative oxidoreductase
VFSSLDRYRDAGLLVARIGFGFGFVWYHGLPKLTGGVQRWAGTGDAMAHLGITSGHEWFGLAAAIAEGVGGLLIALGLFFRPAALALACVMVVATISHMATGEGTPAHAFKNTFLFLGLFLIGPGRYSIDELLSRKPAATSR